MPRILIIDDHPLFREALLSAVDLAYPRAETFEAATLSDALAILDEEAIFDLALLDLKIPGTAGFEGLLEIRMRYPALPVVVVSGHENPLIVKNVLSYGAAGFIPKSTKKNELTAAIKLIMDGGVYIPNDYLEAASTTNDADKEREAIIKKLSTLTRQQLRVIKMLKNGLLNKQIAHELQVGETTVKAHVSEILRKFGVSNRTQAAMEISKLSVVDISEFSSDTNFSEIALSK